MSSLLFKNNILSGHIFHGTGQAFRVLQVCHKLGIPAGFHRIGREKRYLKKYIHVLTAVKEQYLARPYIPWCWLSLLCSSCHKKLTSNSFCPVFFSLSSPGALHHCKLYLYTTESISTMSFHAPWSYRAGTWR